MSGPHRMNHPAAKGGSDGEKEKAAIPPASGAESSLEEKNDQRIRPVLQPDSGTDTAGITPGPTISQFRCDR